VYALTAAKATLIMRCAKTRTRGPSSG